MSQENVEIVQAAFEHFLANGEPMWAVLHDEIEVYDHDIMDAGEYHGHEGVRRWLFDDWATAWSNFRADNAEYLNAGDRVIAVFRLRATGRESGVTVEREDAMVHTVRDGKIARIDYYNSREQALEAVGLQE
jgi:ketosteroid isomerase-like protein